MEPRQASLTSLEWAAVGLGLAFVILLASSGIANGHVQNGDSGLLVRGGHVIVECVQDGIWQECGRIPGSRQTAIGPFPLLQYIPASALAWLGVGESTSLHTLATINLVAFIASASAAGLCLWRRRQTRWLAPLFGLILVSGPVAYYSTTAFGEMLAASLLLGAVVFAYRQKAFPTAVLAVFASMGKETLAPFTLGLIALAVFLSTEKLERSKWRVIGAGALGVVVGMMANLSFNVFRYGETGNLNYLDPLFRVSEPTRVLEHFFMLNFSPASGILFFWPLAWALLVSVSALGLYRLCTQPRQMNRWARPLGISLLYGAFIVGLSIWYSPFGWLAWGPRLAVPLIPSLVFLGLVVVEPTTRAIVDNLLGHRLAVVGVALVIVLAALPQLAGPWTHAPVIGTLTTPDETCAGIHDVIIQEGTEEYFRCLSHIAWRVRPTWIDESLEHGGKPAGLARTLGSLWIVMLAVVSTCSIERSSRSSSMEP